eukprot:3875731-Amphidinium_carterae.1
MDLGACPLWAVANAVSEPAIDMPGFSERDLVREPSEAVMNTLARHYYDIWSGHIPQLVHRLEVKRQRAIAVIKRSVKNPLARLWIKSGLPSFQVPNCAE